MNNFKCKLILLDSIGDGCRELDWFRNRFNPQLLGPIHDKEVLYI